MKFEYTLLLLITFLIGFPASAQNIEREDREQRAREEIERRNQMVRIAQLRRILPEAEERALRASKNRNSVGLRSQPKLNEDDEKAISVNPEDARQFENFLKQANTGIVRLQSAHICSADSSIVQVVGNCPNNVAGKATAYSFRENEYKTRIFADLFFSGTRFSSTGVFTLGVLTNLGDIPLENLTLKTDGIKQLVEFQPSSEKDEVARQYQLLTQGIVVGNHIYKRELDVKANSSYVLRTIAYKGKILKDAGGTKVNILEKDSRKDLTLVFRVIRTHDDESVTLLWKELIRKSPPNITLKAKKDERPPQK